MKIKQGIISAKCLDKLLEVECIMPWSAPSGMMKNLWAETNRAGETKLECLDKGFNPAFIEKKDKKCTNWFFSTLTSLNCCGDTPAISAILL